LDPRTVDDRTTYRRPDAPPVGINHVLVNGKAVVRDGRVDTAARSGRAVRRGHSDA
jgi:N-acyl-D-amino-acid deacylase